jgi:transcriptional regulator with XRE-family HTH domain
MARAALGLGVRELATAADISPNTIARLERGEKLHERTLVHVASVLEAMGIRFLPAGAINPLDGPGAVYGRAKATSPRAEFFQGMWRTRRILYSDPRSAFDQILDLVEKYLDLIEAEGREPDDWEKVSLRETLGELNRSWVYVAYVSLSCGITPPDNQAKDYPLSKEDVEAVRKLTLADYRKAIPTIRAHGWFDRFARAV